MRERKATCMEGKAKENITAQQFRRYRLLSMFLAGSLLVGCAPKVTTGAFTQVSRIESELHKGVSTKMDVRRVLGTPKGSGNAVLPIDPKPREVWYYEDIEVTDIKLEGGLYRANARQQILLVFFNEEVFDGYMWFSNVLASPER